MSTKVLGQRSLSSKSLMYGTFGDPNEVLENVTHELYPSSIGPKEVRVKFLASPINPADINTVQGVYAVKPLLPAIGGNEGVAQVVETGSEVKSVTINDWVIPSQAAFGTWREHGAAPEAFFIKVDNDLPRESLAQLSVNPCTAYRMLRDFVPLEQGATVIQNGANSAVGLNVIQLAKEWQLKTINVIRFVVVYISL